jgi:hypothetical protein
MKIILSILLFCSILLADRDGGPYIGLGYGVSEFVDDDIFQEIKKDDSATMIFYVGAYINKNFSVELSKVEFNSGNSYEAVDSSSVDTSLTFSSLNVNTLAHYAFFDDSLDFYAKFGVGEMSASGVGATGFTMIYGAGVAYRISDEISVKAAYDNYVIDYQEGTTERTMNIKLIFSAIEYQF